MNPLPLAIGAILLIAVGLAGLIGLAIPELREHLVPHWAVAVSSTALAITGIGLWRKRKWALVVYLCFWAIQAVATLLIGAQMRWGSGLVGLAMIVSLSIYYWKDLE
jgi:hypothetical protein